MSLKHLFLFVGLLFISRHASAQMAPTKLESKLAPYSLQIPSEYKKEIPVVMTPEEVQKSFARKYILDELAAGRTDIMPKIQNYSVGATLNDQTEIEQWKKQITQMIQDRKTACQPLDLKKQFGPVRNQGQGGLCYAITSADLIGFKTHRSVSFIDLAFQTKKKEGQRSDEFKKLDGDYPVNTLKVAQEKGVCLTDKFADNKDAFDAIRAEYNIQVHFEKPMCSIYSLSGGMKAALNVAHTVNRNALEEVLDKACGKREKIISDFKIEHFCKDPATPVDPMTGLDQAFAKQEPAIVKLALRNVGEHAMIATSQHWDQKTQECFVEFRNSWGNCSDYPPLQQALFKRQQVICNGGYLTMSKDDLSRQISAVDYLQ